MKFEFSNLLLLASIPILYVTRLAGAEQFTLRQKLHDLVEYKRSIVLSRDGLSTSNNIYTRTTQSIAESLHNSLYNRIIRDESSVDIVILLDSSMAMSERGFYTARRFLARLIGLMPQRKFEDGSIKVAMMTYGLSQHVTLLFGFSWPRGSSKDYVRRAVKKTQYMYKDDHENHGASALFWADSVFSMSNRVNNSDTAKVLLYATNGHITDTDLFWDGSAVSNASNMLKNKGYKLFNIVPGTNVDRPIINDIASSPKTDYIIPVVNTHTVEEIVRKMKSLG